MGFNLTDTGHIPITDTDPTVISVGLTVLAKVLVGVDILGGVEAMVGKVEVMVEAVISEALAEASMVGTVAVLVADTMDGKVDMAATDAYIYAMWGSTPNRRNYASLILTGLTYKPLRKRIRA
jgi:hypothetical protein